MRGKARRLLFGLLTLTGLARRGYFIPHRHARKTLAPPYSALEPLFVEAEPSFRQLVREIEGHRQDLLRIPADGPRLRWCQTWFPRLDAAAAYALVRRERPRRIIEVGSGHSTRFLARAAADEGLATEIIAIDPAPRASIAELPVRHVPALVQDLHPSVFDGLASGDMLFVDSSHIAVVGSDVDRLFLDVLPRLAPGVLVHIHDIFLPDPYPEAWRWREYNEQLLVGALLQGGGFELVFASHYVATRLGPELLAGVVGSLPVVRGSFETSLWLRKR